MEQLTGVDANFLYMETPTTVGHVSSMCIYDPQGTDGAGYEKTRQIIEERLHLLGPFRRRLVQVPFNLDHPYWIEDPEFDLDFHIRESAVAPPGTPEQLSELVARLIARPLDRSRPLWELHVITGLPDGLIAQLTKIHHSTIDGVGGAQLLMNLLDVEPDAPPREPPSEPVVGEPEPSSLEMLGRGVTALMTRPYTTGRLAVRFARDVTRATNLSALEPVIDAAARSVPGPVARLLGRPQVRRQEDQMSGLRSAGITAPKTPFNGSIGPHRRFAFITLSLSDAKKVKDAHGVTVNDVVLGLCAEVLRRYLLSKDALPEVSLRTMIPVSVRSETDAQGSGNRVSGMFAHLHTELADPVERLKAINSSTRSAKDALQALPADALTDVAEFAPPAITARAARVVARTQLANRVNPPFNLIISNVPGPQVPLYSGGARLLHYYPVSAVADTQGLNITVQSYDGRLDFGLVADRELVPDLWDMANMFPDAMDELLSRS